MGHWFTKLFSQGFDVQVISSRDVKDEVAGLGARCVTKFGKAITESDYIVIAAPVYALGSIVDRINEYVKPDSVIIDSCSARIAAEEKLSRLKCHWFGLHGSIVLGSPDPRIMEYLQGQGYNYQQMTAEEHDKLSTTVGLVHFVNMVFDSYLRDEDKKELKSGTVGPLLLKSIEHMRNNSSATYRETQLLNPFMENRRKEFLEVLKEYAECLDKGEFPFSDKP